MNEQNIELLTAILVSIFGIVNVLITVLISPIMNGRTENIKFKKQRLYEAAVELVSFTSEAVMSDLINNNILVEFREKCLQIHMLFKEGKAPEPVSEYMEDVFRIFYHSSLGHVNLDRDRKNVVRNLIRKIRAELAYYIDKGMNSHRKRKIDTFSIEWRTGNWDGMIIAEIDSCADVYKTYIRDGEYYIEFYPQAISRYKIESKMKQIMRKYPCDSESKAWSYNAEI